MVSVVIATYNGEKYILEQIDSIYNQTVAADEVIICDDCSTDATVSLVKNYIAQNGCRNWRVIESKSNQGYCFNFYHGINEVNGDIIFLSDQDDVWLPQKIEKMVAAMADPTIMALSSRYIVIDGNGDEIKDSGIPYLGDVFDDSIEDISVDSQIGCSWVRGFSMCFRSNIKQYMKPLDFKSLLSHDWYISMLSSLVGRSCFLNTVLTKYRYHESNVSLSAMNRKTLTGTTKQKRIKGLEESIAGHMSLMSEKFPNMTIGNKAEISKFIKLEESRIKYLQNGNFFLWLSLIVYMNQYKRYYKSFKGGFRVWLGDLIYRISK